MVREKGLCGEIICAVIILNPRFIDISISISSLSYNNVMPTSLRRIMRLVDKLC